ncbi:uncharacterized protein LOC118763904 [Octopus sinensis]|uniref:Uncharacterized protein LOC118763904 n=1 Tax=Octopus sinensis TaxID=2607531 RepID=A0A7E6EYC3_9MOLL|nr:uncharacterized protein LOC118763904 [Octopus sinensis]
MDNMSEIMMATDQIIPESDLLNKFENIVYIGNIDSSSTEEELKTFFIGINILNLTILKKSHKCFAFAKVGCKSDIDKIFRSYGKLFKSRRLIIKSYKQQSKSNDSIMEESPQKMVSQKTKSKKSEKKSATSHIHNSKQLEPKPAVMPPLEDIGFNLQENETNSELNTSALGKVLRNDHETVSFKNGICLFVGNFPYGTSENDLMELFHPVNPLFALVKNSDNKKYSTQSFIYFWNTFDLKRAIKKFDKSTYKGHVLLVSSPYVEAILTNDNFSNSSGSVEEVQENTTASDQDSIISFQKETARLIHIYREFSLESELLTNEIVVCITRLVNRHCFWAHVVSEKNGRCKEFMSIHKCLQETAFSWKKTKSAGRCVAMYHSKWFRGYILKIISSECAEVFFVDVGNIAEINFQFIRLSSDIIWRLSPMARAFKIPKSFKELPGNVLQEKISLVILKLETASSGYITLVKMKD